MKKLLALVLALVMTLSLATISTNAAFSDAEKFTPHYADAIDLMNQLGIINGMGDGTFDPQGTLTRAQGAKIVAYLLLGADMADSLSDTSVTFKDTVGHWAAPYITFCVSQGIVDGYGDGNFGPDEKLTGHAFGKMVLTALDVEGNFTGAAWALNVAVALADKGLNDGLEDVTLSEALKREESAQLAKNALLFEDEDTKRWEVYDGNKLVGTYDEATDAYVIKSNIGDDGRVVAVGGESLFSEVYDGKVVTGFIVANAATGSYINGEYDVDHPYTTVWTGGDTYYNFNVETGLDKIGHCVEIYCGTTKDGEVDEYDVDWDFDEHTDKANKDHLGTMYALVDNCRVVKVEEDQEDLSASAVKSLLGVAVDSNYAQAAYVFNNENIACDEYGYYWNWGLADGKQANGKYTVYEGTYIFWEDDDDNEWLVAVCTNDTTVDVATITRPDEDDSYYEVALALTNDGENVVEMYEDEDDQLNLITNNVNWLGYIDTDDEKDAGEATQVVIVAQHGAKFEISDVQKVSGKVTSVKNNYASTKDDDDLTFKVDSTSYKFTRYAVVSTVVDALADMIADDNSNTVYACSVESTPASSAEDAYDFYLDGNGKIFAYVKAADAADGEVVIPVAICYTRNWTSGEVDEYGKTKSNSEDQYSFYMQAVDLNGKELKLEFAADADISGLKENSGIRTFLEELADGSGAYDFAVGQDEDSGDYYLYPASEVENGNANIGGDPVAYYAVNESALRSFYDTESKYISGDKETLFDADLGNKAVAGTLATSGVTKDTKSFSVNGADARFYNNSTFTVISINNTGKDMKVSLSTANYARLRNSNAVYGTRNSNSGAYTLKYAVLFSETDAVESDDLVFVSTAAIDDAETVPNTYVDKNGKTQNGTAAKVEIYVEGATRDVKVEIANIPEAAGFYKITDPDAYTGLVTLEAYGSQTELNNVDGTMGATYAMTKIGTADDGSDWGSRVGNLLSTVDGSELDDVDISGATVVNTTSFEGKVTLSSLDTGKRYSYGIYVDLNDDGDEAEFIYIDEVWGATLKIESVNENTQTLKYSGANTKDCDITVCFDIEGEYVPAYGFTVDTGKKTVTWDNSIATTGGEFYLVIEDENCTARAYYFEINVD